MPTKQMRAAVVGASTVLGKELIEELSNSPAAAWDLRLLDETEGEEAQLSAAGDEAVLIQPLSREALEPMDFIFFAGEGAIAREMVGTARSAGAAVVDLTGALEQEEDFLVRCPWLPFGKRPDLTTVGVTVPHPAAVILALSAQRLQDKFGLAQFSATVMEPVSQAGRVALDELHQQTVGLLSFQSVPKDIFDAQVAFNLQASLGENAKVSLLRTASTIRQHLALLLGTEASSQVHFQLVQAPVFHGYTVSALAGLKQTTTEQELRSALHGGVIQAEEDTAPSNTAVVESGEILVSVRSEPGASNESLYWLWVAADNVRLHARVAVAAAMELGSMRPQTAMQ